MNNTTPDHSFAKSSFLTFFYFDSWIGIGNNQIIFFYFWQIARNNLNKFSNADYATRSQSVFANLNI